MTPDQYKAEVERARKEARPEPRRPYGYVDDDEDLEEQVEDLFDLLTK